MLNTTGTAMGGDVTCTTTTTTAGASGGCSGIVYAGGATTTGSGIVVGGANGTGTSTYTAATVGTWNSSFGYNYGIEPRRGILLMMLKKLGLKKTNLTVGLALCHPVTGKVYIIGSDGDVIEIATWSQSSSGMNNGISSREVTYSNSASTAAGYSADWISFNDSGGTTTNYGAT
jgi:hypothetical protein